MLPLVIPKEPDRQIKLAWAHQPFVARRLYKWVKDVSALSYENHTPAEVTVQRFQHKHTESNK